jgi:hypothetical protein
MTFVLALLLYATAHSIFAYDPHSGMLLVAGVSLGGGFLLTVPLLNYLVIEGSTQADRAQYLAGLASSIFLGQFRASFVDMPLVGRATCFKIMAATAAVCSLSLALFRLSRCDAPRLR